MLEKVRKTLNRFKMLVPGERVLAAVSGGPDSSALLHVLWRLKEELGLELEVVHLDHMLRGEESYQDARYVEELARSLGIPAVIKRIDVSAYRVEHGGSLEAAAREVRYELFAQVAREGACRKVALGHNLDDQVETVVMRFLRGTGLQGLSGIPPVRRMGGATIIRPLLEISRAEILAYCREQGLNPRWDSSNQETVYRRNKIRLELIPWLLKEFNPNLKEVVAENALLWREENQYLDQQARDWYDKTATQLRNDKVCLDLGLLEGVAPVLLRRILRRAVIAVKGDGRDLQQVHLQSAQVLVEAGRVGTTLSLPGGIRLEKTYGKVIVRGEDENQAPSPFCYPLPVPGEIVVPSGGFSLRARVVERRELHSFPSTSRERALFDYDLVTEPLYVRSRRPGDRFYPRGVDGSKKLKDYFIDEKIPCRQRNEIPILTTGDEIMWVVGRRLDRRFTVGGTTKQVLVIETDMVKGETTENNVDGN